MTILLLEDEALIALDLQSALEAAGHRVMAFSTNTAAKDWLTKNRPRAAVIDLKLRDGDSTALAGCLAASQVPIVIYTGRDVGTADLVPALDGVPILRKPADQDGVVSVLHARLSAITGPATSRCDT